MGLSAERAYLLKNWKNALTTTTIYPIMQSLNKDMRFYIMSIDTVAMQNEIEAALTKFNEKFISENGKLDWGCCGYGVVYVQPGRQTALRKFLEVNGFITTECCDYYGKRSYALNDFHVANDLHVQNADYNQKRCHALSAAINDAFDKYGIPLISKVRTWID